MSECIEIMVAIAIMFFSVGVLVGEVVGKRKCGKENNNG